jgi:hypothetical protein
MSNNDIKQRRTCRCCNLMYDYAVPGSLSTRFLCQHCVKIEEPLRRVLININKRLIEIESRVKGALQKKPPESLTKEVKEAKEVEEIKEIKEGSGA